MLFLEWLSASKPDCYSWRITMKFQHLYGGQKASYEPQSDDVQSETVHVSQITRSKEQIQHPSKEQSLLPHHIIRKIQNQDFPKNTNLSSLFLQDASTSHLFRARATPRVTIPPSARAAAPPTIAMPTNPSATIKEWLISLTVLVHWSIYSIIPNKCATPNINMPLWYFENTPSLHSDYEAHAHPNKT